MQALQEEKDDHDNYVVSTQMHNRWLHQNKRDGHIIAEYDSTDWLNCIVESEAHDCCEAVSAGFVFPRIPIVVLTVWAGLVVWFYDSYPDQAMEVPFQAFGSYGFIMSFLIVIKTQRQNANW